MNWKCLLPSLLVFVLMFSCAAVAETQSPSTSFDPATWQNLSISEQEQTIEQTKFQMLHERKPELQTTINMMKSYRSAHKPLSSDNMLKIPLRPGKLEVSALFKKARGAILRCDSQKFEAIFDVYRMDVLPDPNKPGYVLARISGGNNPNVPTKPVPATITTNGKTAKITVGADWLSISYSSHEKYIIRTNRVPVKIKAKYID